jgi:O-antigen/teichoic acid export membrane protein
LLIGIVGQIGLSVVVLAMNGFLVWPTFDSAAARELIRRGIPAIGLTLGQNATLRIDRILIGLFLTAAPVGVYSIAATGTELVWLAPTALSQVLFHRFATRSIDLSIATRARILSLVIALLTALTMFLVAPYAIDLLVGARFADAVSPLRILLIAAVFFASYQLDAYALAAQGRIGPAASATLVGFAVVLTADLMLIPMYGIIGAAWASVIAYGLMAAIVRVMLSRSNYQRSRENGSNA